VSVNAIDQRKPRAKVYSKSHSSAGKVISRIDENSLGDNEVTDVCFIFEVHQPFRLNRNFHADLLARRRTTKEDLFDLYFDHQLNREVFDRAAQKCYFPANHAILEQIDRLKGNRKQFKVAYSLSGVFVEQCERWSPDLLESFKQLAQSGCVEFLEQTYYHSLASLFGPDQSEFVDQIRMHRQLIKDLFNYEPRVVENTECIYNNSIAKTLDFLGYRAVVTEGVERVLGWRSPNYLYKARGSDIRVLLRNYRVSDDIGFRFSSTRWEEWPLTAQKYSSWLAASPGEVINIFIDYETFGEHHWPESGIHDFLKWLPGEVIKWDNLDWRMPSEVVERHNPVDEVDVFEYGTISWADLERDTSAWIGNQMQLSCFESQKKLEPPIRELQHAELTKLWRYLQISDHLYYMSTKGAGPGDVHSYFSPLGTPVHAFAVYLKVISDLKARISQELQRPDLIAKRILSAVPPSERFTFFQGFARPTNRSVTSLGEFTSAIESIESGSIEFHMERGDLERWFRQVVVDADLADDIRKLSKRMLRGDQLRKALLVILRRRIKQLQRAVSNVGE